MDGDRPVVDGRYIFESKLQELLCKAWAIGCSDGYDDEWSDWQEELYPKLHELIVSYLDSPTSDVGAQDEASKEGAMGDSVRSEGHIDKFVEGIHDKSKELEESGSFQRAVDEIKTIYKTPGR